jgi:serine O-acetyltransferase
VQYVSPTDPDWSRESKRFWSWQPSRSLLACIRTYQRHRASRNPLRRFLAKVAVLQHIFWSTVTGAEIPINSHLGGGLLIPHPHGIVIHPDAVIGPNCLILQQVTIGVRREGETPPRIGGHVDIGAGAKVLGDLAIGDHALIGANAVVVKDVPPNCTAVGIPARVTRRPDPI